MHCEGRAGLGAAWSRAGIFGSHLIGHGAVESCGDGIGGGGSSVVQLEEPGQRAGAGTQQSFLTADLSLSPSVRQAWQGP